MPSQIDTRTSSNTHLKTMTPLNSTVDIVNISSITTCQIKECIRFYTVSVEADTFFNFHLLKDGCTSSDMVLYIYIYIVGSEC